MRSYVVAFGVAMWLARLRAARYVPNDGRDSSLSNSDLPIRIRRLAAIRRKKPNPPSHQKFLNICPHKNSASTGTEYFRIFAVEGEGERERDGSIFLGVGKERRGTEQTYNCYFFYKDN